MNRLIFLVATLFTVLAAPLAAPALAASTPMEHCDSVGHSAPASDQGTAMNHQACCVAVDPGKLGTSLDSSADPLTSARPIDDSFIVSAARGTDPPPPRLD